MRSMTGYGAGEHAVEPHGKVRVELRALNHRFLEVRVRAARELADLASHAELAARERFSRGRIEVVLHSEGVIGSAPLLDRMKAREAYRQLSELRDEIAPGESVPLSLLAVVPDLFIASDNASDGMREALKRAFDAAAIDLDAMRGREGAALERDLRVHIERVRALVGEIDVRAPDAVAVGLKRLRERIGRITTSVEGAVDPARLEQEIALLADRSDVAEEITRLRSHIEQLGTLIAHDGPVGRRIDFLLQEMTREANTVGSKSADVAITRAVVELKAEIERMREQIQNVE